MKEDQELQSLKRGLKALTLINETGPITIAELGRRIGVPRTNAERLLMTLRAEGYIERDPDTKAFTLTEQVHALSDGYAAEDELVAAARPLMLQMTREIGWPLCLAVPVGEMMSVRVTTDPQTSLNLERRHIGSTGSIGMVSSGLVILAFLEDTQRDIMLDMLRRSDNPSQAGVRDEARMAHLLQQIRADGYSFGLDYGRERSVSVPIMADGQVKAALLMVFMARALTHDAVIESFVPRLKAMAREIERRAPANQAFR